MKKIILTLLLPVVGVIIATGQSEEVVDYCTYADFRDDLKAQLDPYEYDAQKVSKFTVKDNEQTKEIEVPLFIGESYKVIFSQEGMPVNVLIEIYDKEIGKNKRSLLWSNADDMETTVYEWIPEKSKKFYVNYTVPATDGETMKGCMYFVVGYESKFKKDD